MNYHRTTRRARLERRGAMLVLIAVCLPLCIIMAAFAVDIAWMQLARTELRTATDSAARAGAKELSLSQSTSAAVSRAKQAAARNEVAGDALLLNNRDIEIGSSSQPTPGSRFVFTPGGSRPNALRVTGKRTSDSDSGPVDLLFGGVLGIDQFEPLESATSTLLDRDICLVVDRSGSMMWTLFNQSYPRGTRSCDPPHPTESRWGVLAGAVRVFLDELDKSVQSEHLALASYSSNKYECRRRYRMSEINVDLTDDYTLIQDEMDRMSSHPVKGNTAIGAGINEGIKVLTGSKVRPFAVKTMVVLTDGIHNTGTEPIVYAREAATEGIVIHAITFSADADIARMQAVAAATGGRHYHAPTEQQLISIFKEIAATLPVLTTE